MSEGTHKPVGLLSGTWLVYLVFMAAATGVYFLITGSIKPTFYNLVGVAMLTGIFVGIRWHRPANTLAWYIVAFGLGLFVAGDVVFYSVYPKLLNMTAPFPSVADTLYLSSYLVVACGMALLIRRRGRRDYSGIIDAAIIAVGLVLVVWVLLVQPYANDPSLTLLVHFTSVATPLLSVLWVAVAARFVFTPAVHLPAFRLLIAAVLLHPIADLAYAWLVLNGGYSVDHVVNAGWLLSYGLFGAAALHPSMRELSVGSVGQETRTTLWRLALLGVAAMMVPVVFILDVVVDASNLDVPVIAEGSAILLSLVLVRMWRLLRENEGTSAEVRELNEGLERRIEVRTAQLERQATELQRSEARLSEAQRIAHLGSWEWDIITGDIFWSDEVFRLYGYETGAFTPTPERLAEVAEMVHPDDSDSFRKTVNDALYRNKTYDHNYRLVRPDGAERMVHRQARVIFDGAGNPIQMIGTVQDITEPSEWRANCERRTSASAARSTMRPLVWR